MYLLLKSLHLFAVVIFLGNIITGVFWKAHADETGDPRTIAHAMAGIIRSDRYFTIPGVLFIAIFGLWNAMQAGMPIWGTPWIRWSLVLFATSGAAFMRIGALQRQLLAVASAGPWEKARYDQLSAQWGIWGLLGLLTPLGAFFLMVLKPAF